MTVSSNTSSLLNVAAVKKLDPSRPQGFSSLLLVRRVAEKPTKAGTPMLWVDLGDKTGSFTVSIFSDNSYFHFFKTEAIEGSVVLLTAMSSYYQDRFSPKLVEVRKLVAEELSDYPCDDLVSASPESAEKLWEEFNFHVAKIQNEPLRKTVERVIASIEKEFKTSPAGRSVHHAYRHGLLEHTVHILRLVDAALPLYTEVDADLVRAGAALHDTGKVLELTQGMTTTYSRKGTLLGHVVIGYTFARDAALETGLDDDRRERLEHMILSHQGELEYGSPVMAATPEAVFLHQCDLLDSRMGAVQNALRNAGENDEFSERLTATESQILLTPVGEEQKEV
jgi:3'-5' exoribonuclease